MKRISALGIAAIILSSISVVRSTPVQAQRETLCSFTFDATVSPGLTASASKGTWTTNGETGTIDCDGPVKGEQPTGPGKLGIEATYGEGSPEGDTCAGGAGTGRYSATIPTANGPVSMADDFTYRFGRVPSGGQVGVAEFRSKNWSGTVEFVPTEGNCFERPMTAIKGSGRGPLKDA